MVSLSFIGFSKYSLSIDGKLYKTVPALTEVHKSARNCFYMVDDNGTAARHTLKAIYREAYKKEFCIDKIQSLPFEEWKEIPNTNGKYFVSNCGRIKSYYGYKAILLQAYSCNDKKYLKVKINGKNILVHKIVAYAFCEHRTEESAV